MFVDWSLELLGSAVGQQPVELDLGSPGRGSVHDLDGVGSGRCKRLNRDVLPQLHCCGVGVDGRDQVTVDIDPDLASAGSLGHEDAVVPTHLGDGGAGVEFYGPFDRAAVGTHLGNRGPNAHVASGDLIPRNARGYHRGPKRNVAGLVTGSDVNW